MLSTLQYKTNLTEYELSFHISQEENLWEDLVIIVTEIVVEIIVVEIIVVILITAAVEIVALITVVLETAALVTTG